MNACHNCTLGAIVTPLAFTLNTSGCGHMGPWPCLQSPTPDTWFFPHHVHLRASGEDPVSQETIPEPSPSRYLQGITTFSVPTRPTSGRSPDIKLEFTLLSHDRQSPSATKELRMVGSFLNFLHLAFLLPKMTAPHGILVRKNPGDP